VVEPLPPLLDRERLDIEGDDGALDVVVVDRGERRQVVDDPGADVAGLTDGRP
jgi:hypothetical protein